MLSIRPQPSCRCMTALAACATKNGASRFSRTTEVTRLGDADAVRPGADEDLGPGVPESPGDGQADAAGAAGDEGNPAGHIRQVRQARRVVGRHARLWQCAVRRPSRGKGPEPARQPRGGAAGSAVRNAGHRVAAAVEQPTRDVATRRGDRVIPDRVPEHAHPHDVAVDLDLAADAAEVSGDGGRGGGRRTNPQVRLQRVELLPEGWCRCAAGAAAAELASTTAVAHAPVPTITGLAIRRHALNALTISVAPSAQ